MRRLLFPLALLPVVIAPCAAADDETLARLAPLSGCETVFVGKLTRSIAGPVAKSLPPIYSFTLEFEVTDTLRGAKPDAKSYRYSFRGNNPPNFGVGTAYVVGAKKQQDFWVVAALSVDGEAERKAVKKLLSVPVGWTWDGDKPVSPWAALGEKAWPKGGPKLSDVVCSKSGRPAALVGDGVEVTVEQVPAENPMKFKNDSYGDGKFKITLKNTTKEDVTVPAVLTNGEEVLWADSVLFLYQNKPLVLPTAGKITSDSKPLTIKAGASVSGEVNSLLLDGVNWPRGGQRVYFDIAVGEKAVNNFFYYYSMVHDPMREAALKAIEK